MHDFLFQNPHFQSSERPEELKPMSVTMHITLLEAINRKAKSEDRSRSAVIRRAVAAYLGEETA